MPRRSSRPWDFDSQRAIDAALRSCDSTFKATLFRSKISGQVLYLEAEKDFIDTLISFLLLPLGNVIHMVSTEKLQTSGILSIFKSVESLDTSLLHINRSSILAQQRPAAYNPSGLSKVSSSTGLLYFCQDAAESKRPVPPKKKWYLPERYYKCENCTNLSSNRGARCYSCSRFGNHHFREGPYGLCDEDVKRQDDIVAKQSLEPVEEEYNSATGPGFVKENVTFMVTDELYIMPSTTSESMRVPKSMNVNSLDDLERTKIAVTTAQVLCLLRRSLTSTTCLNDTFGTGVSSTSRIPGRASSSELQEATAKVTELQVVE